KQPSRVGRRMWVPLALAIFFPASLIAQMWWTGVRFSAPMLAILVAWIVMTLVLIVSLLRKRRRYLDATKP
ncbi:MAG TPA: hypothetical protein VLV86_18280, partial [Vicinamibacterales bacterium]|nr:hypothetical protein [Vicinamibacterales bacterium]